MAEKEIKIKVSTETDIKNVEDLKNLLENMEDSNVNVDVSTDDSSLNKVEENIEDLNGRHIVFDTDIDVVPLNQVQRIINDLDGEKVNVEVGTDVDGVNYAVMEVEGLDGKKVNIDIDYSKEGLRGLYQELNKLDKKVVTIHTDVNNRKIHTTRSEIEKLNGKHIVFDTDIDTVPLKQLKRIVSDLDGDTIKFKVDVNDKGLVTAKMEVQDLDGERAEINIDCDDSSLEAVQKQINDLKGEHIQIDVDVDDSQIKKAQNEVKNLGDDLKSSLSSTESAINGLVAGMAGKSVWDTIYGTSKKAETNKVLLRNMADTTIAYEDFYNTIDKTTDESLISMQSLIPALNAIQSATGATGETMNQITPQVAEFGQYVLALYGSEALAESAMMDLSKGLKGACASLDQYGITEDALKNTGLWTGKEDDVIGFMNAVDELDGETNQLMDTAQGLEALMGKAFSRGGKRLGEYVLPAVKSILTGFMQLDTATNGWLSTSMLATAGVVSGLASFLSVAGQAITGAENIAKTLKWLSAVEIAEGVSGLFAIGWLLLLIAIGVAVGLMFVYLYNNVDWFREGVDNAIATLQNLASIIWSSIIGTLQWLTSEFQKFTNSIGLNSKDWVQAILGFILFLPQLPLKVGQLLLDTLMKALGFGDDFTNSMINGAINSVNGFVSYIISLPDRLGQELNKMLDMARNFALQIADILSFGGASMVLGWVTGSGEHSPGFMYDALLGELNAMVTLPLQILPMLVDNISQNAMLMANALSEALLGVNATELIDMIINDIFRMSETFGGFSNYVLSLGGLLSTNVAITGNGIIDTFIRVVGFIATLPIQLATIFANSIARTLGFGDNFSKTIVKSGQNAVNGFLKAIGEMATALGQEFDKMLQMALNFAGELPRIIWNVAVNTVKSWVGGTNEHSPGDMYDAFEGELKAMETLPIQRGSTIQTNIGRMGKDMVDIFSDSMFSGEDISNNKSSVLNNEILTLLSRSNRENMGLIRDLILNIGTVDDEKRIDEIIDRIKRELHWDNIKAGRTV